ncbi:MAG: lipoate--protein ligase family protein [Bacilli bacterium]
MESIYLAKAPPVYRASVLLPFVEQEAHALFCRELGRPVLRVWAHERCLLLGARDASLPHAALAALEATKRGLPVAVRPFGGLAIPLDAGVANVTLMLPGAWSLDEAFTVLCNWLLRACEPYGPVSAGEVPGAYCPGRYDLSIAGVKFAGVAQRRITAVTAVSAFVNVVENGFDREGVVEDFYRTAVGNSTAPSFVPVLSRGTVGNLVGGRDAGKIGHIATGVAGQHMRNFYDHLITVAKESQAMMSDLPDVPARLFDEASDRLHRRLQLKEWPVS